MVGFKHEYMCTPPTQLQAKLIFLKPRCCNPNQAETLTNHSINGKMSGLAWTTLKLRVATKQHKARYVSNCLNESVMQQGIFHLPSSIYTGFHFVAWT